jgi:CRP-like cAMP-binding protein
MTRPFNGNHILNDLSTRDYEILKPDLELVDLPTRRELVGRSRPIEFVYFMDSGIASIVTGSRDKPVEVGVIGREGFAPVNVIMGAERSHHEAFVQVAGTGRRIRADILREADEQSLTLHRILVRYVHTFLLHISETALANASCKIEERLARWLLVCHDRLDGEEVPMTHEFLSLMLATPRPGTTVAVQTLAKEGLIESSRGKITILDRAGLEARCTCAYEPVAERAT